MRVVTFGAGSITLELDPSDCLMLGAACEAAIKNDAIPNLVLCEALQSVMALGAAVGAATSHMHDDEPFTAKAISDTWMPVDDRYVH